MPTLNRFGIGAALLLSSCDMKEGTETCPGSDEIKSLREEVSKLAKELEETNDYQKRLMIPCEKKALEKVNSAKEELLADMSYVQKSVESECVTRTDCKIGPEFWVKFSNSIKSSYVFCPLIEPNKDSLVQGIVVGFPENDYPGALAIFGPQYKSPCVIEGTIAHEIGHLVGKEGHKNTSTQDDWIYLIGQKAEEKCMADFRKN